MRRFFLFYLSVFIGILTFGCKRDNPSDDFLYPDTIMGHWDIEGGGTLFFEKENFSLSAGCNTLFGEVTIESSTLSFSMIASTLIGCSGPEGIREKELKALLDSVIFNYYLDKNRAYLENIKGQQILTLTRPTNEDLINSWKLTSLRTEFTISSSVLDEDSGITFLKEDSVEIQTSCNSGFAAYNSKNEGLSIKDFVLTEMACEKERVTRESEFIQALLNVDSYSILRQTLTLEKQGQVYLTFKLSD